MNEIKRPPWLDGVEIDERVQRLVFALNRFPGVITTSSCGGHDDPGPGQCGAGEFTVSLDVDPMRGGWRSLELLSYALAQSENFSHLELSVWNSGGVPSNIAFETRGRGDADPDELARRLMKAVQLYEMDDRQNGQASAHS